MALAKLGDGITSITGTFGGSVFKRDASGQHITSKQRHVKKERTPEQKAQNNWYSQIKRTEKQGGEVDNPITESPNEGCVKIYGMKEIHATRTLCLGSPTREGIVYSNLISPNQVVLFTRWYHDLIANRLSPLGWTYEYITTTFPGLPGQLGMTIDEIARIVSQYYRYFKSVEKCSDAEAEIRTRLRFSEIVNRSGFTGPRSMHPKGLSQPGGAVAASALLIALVGAMVIGDSGGYGGKTEGGISFTARRVLIEIGNVMVFGSVKGRPSENCIDYAAVGNPAFQTYTINYWPKASRPVETHIDTLGIFTSHPSTFGPFSYLYTWGEILCVWWGSAYEVETGIYRKVATPGEHHYWSIPVGFCYDNADIYGYVNLLPEYWRPYGEFWPAL